jgi:toxin YoeB
VNLTFTPKAWADYTYWLETDKTLLRKINALIKEVLRSPFEGTGQPEALKHDLAGYWSRRMTQEHRLVYAVNETSITIISCRFHYDK